MSIGDKYMFAKILEIDKSSKIGILTNGAFYVIDKDSRDLISHPENGFFTDFEKS